MASLRSAEIAPREVVAEATETDHGKERLVCFGVLDNDGRDPTWARLGQWASSVTMGAVRLGRVG